MRKIILGTRKSPLALAQTEIVRQLLEPYVEIEIKTISTEGDKNLDIHYKNSPISLKGFFTKEIEQSLLDCEIDIAIHSSKDLPSIMPEGLVIGGYSSRADARDVLISKDNKSLLELREGAIIGTSSIRRETQLQLLRSDLVFKPIRGNVNTRLNKLKVEEYDGIILAAAGVQRLGYSEIVTQYFSISEVIPSPSQGIIALQCREDDKTVYELCRTINDTMSELSATIERGISALYGHGCSSPLACYTEIEGSLIHLRAMISHQDRILQYNKTYELDSADNIIKLFQKEVQKTW